MARYESISDLDIHLNGCTVFRLDRNRQGGGVIIDGDEHSPVKRVLELEFDRNRVLEIKFSSYKFFIGTYYRRPGESHEQVAQFLNVLQRSIDVAYT